MTYWKNEARMSKWECIFCIQVLPYFSGYNGSPYELFSAVQNNVSWFSASFNRAALYQRCLSTKCWANYGFIFKTKVLKYIVLQHFFLLTLTLTLSHTHTHSFTHTLTLSHTHTHTHTNWLQTPINVPVGLAVWRGPFQSFKHNIIPLNFNLM